jgi:hypothetical protein
LGQPDREGKEETGKYAVLTEADLEQMLEDLDKALEECRSRPKPVDVNKLTETALMLDRGRRVSLHRPVL